MKAYIYKLYFSFLALLMLAISGCNKDDKSSLSLNGDTFIEKIVLDEQYEGEIDNKNASITVGVPFGYDTKAMTVSQLALSEGAEASIKEGDKVNFSVSQSVKVTNGDTYFNYTISVKHDEAKILSFKLNNLYLGYIDNETETIKIYVPYNTDVTNMVINYEVEEGTIVSVENNSTLDFTTPVNIKVEFKTAVRTYKVIVEITEISQEPKAFIGKENSINDLGDEAKAAAEWMIEKIPNSVYISLNEIKDGTVRLEDYKMIWCHFDWTDWPSIAWDSREKITAYWMSGGNIFASRDGARYINDVWLIAKNQQSPNDISGGETDVTLESDLGFSVKGYETHEIYNGLQFESENSILYLKESECKISNRVLQWIVNKDPYTNMDDWKQKTGAEPLASSDTYDENKVTVAEFKPRESGTKISGTVITVGTPAFEWKDADVNNEYFSNMEKLTKNIINYLCK